MVIVGLPNTEPLPNRVFAPSPTRHKKSNLTVAIAGLLFSTIFAPTDVNKGVESVVNAALRSTLIFAVTRDRDANVMFVSNGFKTNCTERRVLIEFHDANEGSTALFETCKFPSTVVGELTTDVSASLSVTKNAPLTVCSKGAETVVT